MKINKKIIKELSDYLEEFNLTELEYTEKDTKIKVSKNNVNLSNLSPSKNEKITETSNINAKNISGIQVTSPIIGTAYHAPEPGAKKFDGIIINAAAFTHTSVAIRDALDIFKKPIIEIHMSNIYKREEFRKKSLISDVVTGGIFGLGDNGYILAIISMQKLLKNENK